MRRCGFCHAELERKVVRGGELECPSSFAERKYCDTSCYAAARTVMTQQLHMADIARIYDARKGRKAPSLLRVVNEVQAEVRYIQAQQGRQ